MDERRKTGIWGEILAVRYLRQAGYRILMTNFRAGTSEVDIIAKKGNLICLVEVKTRSPGAMLSPAENVDREKQRRMLGASSAVLRLYAPDADLRFDIAEVIFSDPKNYRINYIKNAF